tara:strand:- start:3711 stop:4463 length:753 start_codon:yes stop_codon:yes gene_type:complete
MNYFFLFLILTISNFVFSQTELPFIDGERASYNLYFGSIKVGYADMEIKESIINEKATIHAIGRARSAPFFDWFFKVRDLYETFIDKNTILPIIFNRSVNEGGYKINQQYYFDHMKSTVATKDSIFFIPPLTQDMLSAFFLARTYKKEYITKYKSIYVPIFMDNDNYLLEIKYLYNDVIETKWGKIECMVFQPLMQEGRVFENGEKLKIWITDDSNHMLLRVEAEIWAGTVRAIISDYKNSKYPLTIIKN